MPDVASLMDGLREELALLEPSAAAEPSPAEPSPSEAPDRAKAE
jgi:hypothetical protein